MADTLGEKEIKTDWDNNIDRNKKLSLEAEEDLTFASGNFM